MCADLGLTATQNPRAGGFQMVTRGKDVIDLVADMVNAARGVLFQKAVDRAVLAQRIKQFDLSVGQFDEHDRDTVIGLVLRRADLGTKRAAILLGGSGEVRHGDGHMVEASDHGMILSSGLRLLWGCWPRLTSDRGTQATH